MGNVALTPQRSIAQSIAVGRHMYCDYILIVCVDECLNLLNELWGKNVGYVFLYRHFRWKLLMIVIKRKRTKATLIRLSVAPTGLEPVYPA